jgi:hypothetical protein
MHQVKAYPSGEVMADYRTGIPAQWRLALDDDAVVVELPALINTQFSPGNAGAGLGPPVGVGELLSRAQCPG